MIGLILGTLLFGIEVLDENGKELCSASNAIITRNIIQLTGCNSQPPLPEECITNATTLCKGDIDTSINGEYYNERIWVNKTNVYKILPRDRDAVKFSFRYFSNVMVVSLSTNPYADSTRKFCTKDMASGSIYINTNEVYGSCTFSRDEIVFLRVTSPQSGELSIFW